jgi:hypothetical protein
VVLQDGSVGERVHKILGHRHKERGDEYLIEWLGAGPPTWEPVAHLFQVQWLIEAYIEKQHSQQARENHYRSLQGDAEILSCERSCHEVGRRTEGRGRKVRETHYLGISSRRGSQ